MVLVSCQGQPVSSARDTGLGRCVASTALVKIISRGVIMPTEFAQAGGRLARDCCECDHMRGRPLHATLSQQPCFPVAAWASTAVAHSAALPPTPRVLGDRHMTVQNARQGSRPMEERRSSYEYEDLLACGRGELFGAGNAQLPLPPMLMFDRVSEIGETGGEHGRGLVRAVLDHKHD